MNTIWRTLPAMLVLMLGGCAANRPMTAEEIDGRVVCDEARMAKIEATARRSFTELHWVQCPTATLRVARP